MLAQQRRETVDGNFMGVESQQEKVWTLELLRALLWAAELLTRIEWQTDIEDAGLKHLLRKNQGQLKRLFMHFAAEQVCRRTS